MALEKRIQHSPKGTRLIIGAGEEADIFRYIDGMLMGRVGRVPKGTEHYGPNTEKNALLRYRRHQIAHLLFPQYNINVVGLDLSDREMYSMEVERSKSNLKAASSHGLSRRNSLKHKRDVPKKAEAAIMEMAGAGVIVHTGEVNVSVGKNDIKLFEVIGIIPEKARIRLTSHDYPPASVEKGLLLIEALEFERKLPDIELFEIMRDPAARNEILQEQNKVHLEKIYSQEIGNTITV